MSYITQSSLLLNNRTVKKNVEYFSNNVDDLNKTLEMLKIGEKLDSHIDELSGGQRQRVSIALGLAKNYKILIVDEPTASIDSDMELFIFKYLKELSKDKLVLLVSHNINYINSYSDLIIKMDDGKIKSIYQNNTQIEYGEKSIEIYGEAPLHALDLNKAQEIFQANKEIIIKSKDININPKELSYKNNVYSHEDVPISKKHRRHIGKELLSTNKLLKIVSFVVIIINLFMLSIFLDFKFFDFEQFVYNVSVENHETTTNVVSNNIGEEIDNSFVLKNRSETLKIDKYTGCTLENVFDIKDEFYTKDVYGRVVSDDFKLVAGDTQNSDGKLFITDYIADGLIKRDPKYLNYSYDDLLEKGINVYGTSVEVAGIIDTDYEYYYEKEYLSETEKYNLEINIRKVYSTFAYLESDKTMLSYGSVNYSRKLNVFVKLEKNENGDNSKFVGNYSLKKILDDLKVTNYETKFDFGIVSDLEFIDDGISTPMIYLSEKQYNLFLNEKTSRFDSINISFSSPSDLKPFFDESINFNNYSAQFIYKIANDFKTFNDAFLVPIVFFSILLLLTIYLYLYIGFRFNNKKFVISLMSGVEEENFTKIEAKSNLFEFLIVSILFIPFYLIGYLILNSTFVWQFGSYSRLFINHIWVYLVIFVIFLILSSISYIVLNKIRKRKSFIKLVN